MTLWTSTGNGYNQFYDITERRVDADDNPLAWADRLAVIVGDTRNNPFHNELEKMRAQFEGTERERQALEGGFSAAEGLVYSTFTRETHIITQDDISLRQNWRLYGYDYGHADPRVLLEIGRTLADQYVVLDSYYRDQQPIEALIDPREGSGWVIENEKPLGEVYCDHDPEHIQKFRDAGYEAYAATKDLDEGIEEVRSVLETDMDGRPGLLVVDECTELIQEFQSYKEEDVGSRRATDHALDALRYAIMGDRYYVEDDGPSGSGTW